MYYGRMCALMRVTTQGVEMGFAPIKQGHGVGHVRAPAGNHIAVCVGLIDLGTQWQDPFQGGAGGDKGHWAHKVYMVWELVNERIAGTEKNHVIACDLTLSLHEKAKFRHIVEGRTGKRLSAESEVDPAAELGQACMLNVLEKNGYPRVSTVGALPKGIPVGKASYPLTSVTIEAFISGAAVVPEWVPYLFGCSVEDHMRASQEMGGPKPVSKGKGSAPPPPSAPIPF